MKKIFFCFFALLMVGACDFDSTSGSDNGTADTPDTTPDEYTPDQTGTRSISPPVEADRLITGQQVGKITVDATEADIIRLYGPANVQRREIGLGEGETAPGTVVFPGTDDELIIEWQPGKAYEEIANIRIDGENAKWETEQGIKIGTTLEELEDINGKEFRFYGFEWDYAGTANEWNGGKINPKISVTLTPDNPEATFPDLLGDQLFPSDHPKAAAAGLKVSSISIKFDE